MKPHRKWFSQDFTVLFILQWIFQNIILCSEGCISYISILDCTFGVGDCTSSPSAQSFTLDVISNVFLLLEFLLYLLRRVQSVLCASFFLRFFSFRKLTQGTLLPSCSCHTDHIPWRHRATFPSQQRQHSEEGRRINENRRAHLSWGWWLGLHWLARFRHRHFKRRHPRAWCQPTAAEAKSQELSPRPPPWGAASRRLNTAGRARSRERALSTDSPERGGGPSPGSVWGVRSGATVHWDSERTEARRQCRSGGHAGNRTEGSGEGRRGGGLGGPPRRRVAYSPCLRSGQGWRGAAPWYSLG